jgi:hypothetical protein
MRRMSISVIAAAMLRTIAIAASYYTVYEYGRVAAYEDCSAMIKGIDSIIRHK